MNLLSVIIVNYNVKDFLEQALISIRRALQNIQSEIIVVDNASVDGSVQMLKERFPDVHLIESKKNVGFSAGNNLGINIANGEFIVLINPDTVVQEDTFTKLLDFFKSQPDASAATCKILNPDGTFSIDCRHSVPTPLTAFWKLIGLNRLYPKSRIFAKYNLTYLDENELNQVEAISGSFMMLRKEVVKKIGGLDEDFFMYCEDIDYCHRINKAGGKIFYVPDSQIVHYKGESTKKNNLDYVITFNKSLYLFYKKHYQQKYITPFKWLILLGVIFRGFIIYTRNLFSTYYPLLIDLFLLNSTLFFGFYLRQPTVEQFDILVFLKEYYVVNLITSLIFFLNVLSSDMIIKDRFSISKTIKANFITYTLVAASTFFLRQFAFSRLVVIAAVSAMLVVIAAALVSPLLMIFWRMIARYVRRKATRTQGKQYFLKRALVVGMDNEAKNLLDKLSNLPDSGLNIIGLISLKAEDIGKKIANIEVVAAFDQLNQYLDLNKIDLVIFTTNNISYEQILTAMAEVKNRRVEFKMVPDHLEFIIGKSDIERLVGIPLVAIEYAYRKPFNRFVKRSFDLVTSMLILLFLLPLTVVPLIFIRKNISRKLVPGSESDNKSIFWYSKKGFLRFALNIINIFMGTLSYVGARIDSVESTNKHFNYKPGLTGIVQLKSKTEPQFTNLENLEIQYLKNQEFMLDIEILLKSIYWKFRSMGAK